MGAGTELSEAHDAVAACAAAGTEAVLGRFEAGDVPAYDDERAWAGRTVDGAWLADLLAGGGGLHRRGVVIVGARVTGGLDLECADLDRRFRLVRCQLGDGRISLHDARARTVHLTDVRCGGFDADRAEVAGSLVLRGLRSSGEVRLVGARVAGGLELHGARLHVPGAVALHARGVEVAGSVWLRDATVRGEVNLVNAKVGGDLSCAGSRLSNPGAVALRASRATLAGNLFLDHGFAADGQVRLAGTGVRGNVRCAGATITSPDGVALDLETAQVGESVDLTGGVAATGQVRLAGATVGGTVDCAGARFEATDRPAVDATGAHVTGGVHLRDGFTAAGGVLLDGASIGGDLSCPGARLTAARPGARTRAGTATPVLSADRAQVGGGVFLRDGFTAVGEVRFAGASVGILFFSGGTFSAGGPGETAINVSRARVTGSVILRGGFSVSGRMRMAGTVVGGNVDCRQGRFSSPGDRALDAANAQVGGTFLLTGPGTVVEGELHLAGAAIGGNLDCAGVRLDGGGPAEPGDPPRGGTAVDAYGLRVTGGVFFNREASVRGTVRLVGATIGADLICASGTFAHPGGVALTAERSHVGGSVFLHSGFAADGEVRLAGASVGGSLTCAGGRFANPGGRAVDASRAQVTGSVLLRDGFAAEGEVHLLGIGVGGDLDARGGQLAHEAGNALDASTAQVAGGVFLDHGFTARGTVRLVGLAAGTELGCGGGRFTGAGAGAAALDASAARVTGRIALHQGFRAEGPVLLRGTTAGTLRDDRASWPEVLDVDGFRYGALSCPAADRGWRARRDWLRRQQEPTAHAYAQLAAVYRASGDESDARRTLMERHDALLDPPERWRDHLPSGWRGATARAWRRVLRYTIGHGFAPARSLLIAVPLVVALAVWLGHARSADMLVPTDETPATAAASQSRTGGGPSVPRAADCDADYPCLQPVVYALDNVVPIVDLGQRSRWTPDQSHRGAGWWDDGRWLAAALWAASAVGWILATLVAASFTQVVRRE